MVFGIRFRQIFVTSLHWAHITVTIVKNLKLLGIKKLFDTLQDIIIK